MKRSFKTTQHRVLERYNAVRRRPNPGEDAVRAALKKAFDHEIAGDLPHDKTAAILDAGCGEGGLLDYLRTRGYGDLSGFDLSPQNVALCHGLGLAFVRQADLLELVDKPAEKTFDLIFAFDVIEHIEKARAADAIEALRLRLKPGGALLVRMPNMGYLLANFYRHGDLTHEFGVTENSVVDLLLAAGFAGDRIEVRAVWEGHSLLGRLRELYLAALHRLVALADGRGRPRIATKNLLAVCRIPADIP
jgi:2-polyprenyl-3-methyl-5-hydroxy-6-metoxy-1,4-benzoquinol methylase